MNDYTCYDRDNPAIKAYLEIIPKHKVIAEIGIWEGHFSRLLLKYCEPSQLILIDPWKPYGFLVDSGQKPSDYKEKYEKAAAAHEARYETVKRLFVSDSRVKIWRMTSFQAVRKALECGMKFDFVYIDGDHRYPYIFSDLCSWSLLLAKNGFLGGHDYIDDAEKNIHVIQAVQDFCRIGNFEIFYISDEQYASFLLRRVEEI